jgi:predicted sulfurtransferase
MNRKAYFIFAALIVVNALMVAVAGAASEAPRMSKEELKSRLSDKNIVLIDVRTDRDWTRSDSKIKGAVREDPVNVATWAKKYPKDKTIVLYCA